MKRFLRVLLAIALIAGVGPNPLDAQSAATGQPAPPSTGVIVGQVMDAAAGRPVGGAIVTLIMSPPPRPPLPLGTTLSPAELAARQAAVAPRRIMTDGSGAFVFHSLPAGSFALAVAANGYLNGGFGQLRPGGPTKQFEVDAGERRAGITIKLWPYASISGTITDESADPAVGVSARLGRVTSVNGQKRFASGQTTQTDDRGAYRFGQLSPGDYLVVVQQTATSMPVSTVDTYLNAMSQRNGEASVANLTRDLQASGGPSASASGLRIAGHQFITNAGNRPLGPPTPTESGKTFAYHTMFFPSAPTAAEASVIALVSGQDRTGIDLQLRPVPTVRVSGLLTGLDGPAPNLGVKLLPATDGFASDNGFETATTATDAFGAYTFPAVPPGSYTVRVLKVPRTAPPPPPPPPPPPGGRGAPAPPPIPRPVAPVEPVLWAEMPVSIGDTDMTDVNLMLRPGARIMGRIALDGAAQRPTAEQMQRIEATVSTADGRANLVSGGPVRADASGAFTTLGYPPGRYTLSAGGSLPGWYFKGATIGGRNLDEEPLEIQGSDVVGVTLTFTDRTTLVSGTVRDPSIQRDLAAMVVFFPANYPQWLERGTIGRRVRNMTVGGSGAFFASGLQPGDYLVAAVSADAFPDARDRATYDALARIATRFTLSDGEKKTLDLTVSPIR